MEVVNEGPAAAKTKQFQEVIQLIGKTITKKPKNKRKRHEFSIMAQEYEKKVFGIIRSNANPVIFIFQFLQYIKERSKAGVRVGGRMLYYLSRVLHEKKTTQIEVLQKYAMDIILQKKIDYSFYADIILYLDLIDNSSEGTARYGSNNIASSSTTTVAVATTKLLSQQDILSLVLEIFKFEQETRKNYCKSTVDMIVKLCLHDYFEPERFIKVLVECKNQNVISLQNLLCKGNHKYQVCLIHYAWNVKKDLKRATKLIKLFKIDPHKNYPKIVQRNYENQLRWIIREGIFDLAAKYINKYDINTRSGLILSEQILRYLCVYGLKKLGKNHPVLQSWVQLYRKRNYESILNTKGIIEIADVKNPPENFIVCNFDDPAKNPEDYLDGYCYLDPNTDIIMVDSRENASLAAQHLMGSKVIGFDSEWRATSDVFFEEESQALEVFQISSLSKCYLFDCKLSSLRLYGDILLELMENKNVTKVGYAVGNDTSKLKGAVERALLLNDVDDMEIREEGNNKKKKGCSQFENIVDIHDKKIAGGLAGLVKHYMGKPLKKTQQMSDWTRRPLLKQQIIYAALDAFVCVYIYNLQNAQ